MSSCLCLVCMPSATNQQPETRAGKDPWPATCVRTFCGMKELHTALHTLSNERTLRDAVLEDSKANNLHLEQVQRVISDTLRTHPNLPLSSKGDSNLKSSITLLSEKRSMLTHLFEDCKKIDDSVSMARVLERKWTPVWNKKHPPSHTLFSYLDTYHKRLSPVPPYNTLPCGHSYNKTS